MLSPSTTILAFNQDSTTQANESEEGEQKVEVFSQVREELHRYMGYEELLSKYISLPYDVSMNTNMGSSFVDVSYLFLMFLPMLLLLGLKNRWLKVVTVFLMVLFMIISLPNGYRAFYKLSNERIASHLDQNINSNSFGEAPLINFKLQFTKVANNIYQPIHKSIIQRFSGEGDSITYPIFLHSFYSNSND